MSYINEIISDKMIHALGWMVVHSLWQAMLVALLLAVVLVGLQKKTAKIRYILSVSALVTILLAAIFTFFYYLGIGSEADVREILLLADPSLTENNADKGGVLSSFFQSFQEYFNMHLPMIVTIWMVGAAFFMLRLLGGLSYLQHLRHHKTGPLPPFWEEKMKQLAAKIPIKRTVSLLESGLIKVPMVIGYLKPVILLPVGTVVNLSPQQIEAILAHELAHITRNDFLLNIFQSLVEVIFYFNPAVWWISANIRNERENCCDDIAVELCGNSLAYARALVTIQEMEQSAPTLAMNFSGKKNQLLNRVRRILNQPKNKSDIMEKFTATCLLLLAVLLLSVSANHPFQNSSDNPKVEVEVLPELPALSTSEQVAVSDRQAPLPELDRAAIKVVDVLVDSFPKGNIHISHTQDGESIEAKIKDGTIRMLKVNGEEVPESEYGNYEDRIAEMINDVPKPPTPPKAPTPPTPPTPPTHTIPAPPAPPTPPAPPVPPAPPAPVDKEGNHLFSTSIMSSNVNKEVVPSSESVLSITRVTDEDGQDVIIISPEKEGDLVQYKIKDNGVITFLEGEEISIIEGKLALADNAKVSTGDGNIIIGSGLEGSHARGKSLRSDNGEKFFGIIKSDDNKIKKDKLNKKMGIGKVKSSENVPDLFFKDQPADVQMRNGESKSGIIHNQGSGGIVVQSFPKHGNGTHTSSFFPKRGKVNPELQSAFEKEMLDQKLVDHTYSYKLEISGDKLIIDSKEQPKAVLNHFKEIYEQSTGLEFFDGSRITILKQEEAQ